MTEDEVVAALEKVVEQLSGGELRPGQVEMTQAVVKAFNSKEHLLVEAGTGVGKSLAYLVPAALLAGEGDGNQVVISTATKVLQDQLAKKDLPKVCDALEDEMQKCLDRPLQFAVLKGRDNYVCQLRLAQHTDQPALPQIRGQGEARETRTQLLADLVAWARETKVGDRAEFDVEPSANKYLPEVWRQVSLNSRECVGKTHCVFGETCFTEEARERAAKADIIVTNHSLYTLAASFDAGVLLPVHDFVIIDEAHRLEDTATDSYSTALAPWQFDQLADQADQALQSDSDFGENDINALREFAGSFRSVLKDHLLQPDYLGKKGPSNKRLSLDGSRHKPSANIYKAEDVADELRRADGLLENLIAAIGPANAPAEGSTQRTAAPGLHETSDAVLNKSLDAILTEVRALADVPEKFVVQVSGTEKRPSLSMSPISVGDILAEKLWPGRTAILTSATIGSHLADQLGIPGNPDDE